MSKWSTKAPPVRGLISPARIGAPGGPTPAEARGYEWVRTSRWLYVPSHVDRSVPEQRIVEVAARLPEGAAVTGWAALRMHGAGYFDGLGVDGKTRLSVHVSLGAHNIRQGAGFTVTREPLDPSEVAVVQGVPCTVVPRALFDEQRRVEFASAVVAMDMTSAARLTSVSRQVDYTAARVGQRGAKAALDALLHARDGSASPNETRLRLIWSLDAGLPEPLLNADLFDSNGNHLGTVDLFDADRGLAAEFDGADHRTAHRHQADVVREDRMRRVGVELVRVTGPDLRDPRRVVDRLQAAARRARSGSISDWTLEPPPWWTHAPGVEEELFLRDWSLEQLELEARRS